MNKDAENVKTITTPEQAIDQFVGEQFIEWFLSFVLHEIKAGPGLISLKNKTTHIEKLRKFFLQRFFANEAFWGAHEGDPGFLGFIIANLSESDDPQAETVLEYLEKRQEQGSLKEYSGAGASPQSYADLWQRLLRTIGLSEEDVKKSSPKPITRNFVAELSDIYSNSDWHLAIGALAAQELAETEENKAIFDLVRTNTEVSQHDLEILVNHKGTNSQATIFANRILNKIVYDEETKGLIVRGAIRQLEIRKEFLKGLMKYL